MKFEGRKVFGIVLIIAGIVFILNSFVGITGFAVLEGVFGEIGEGWSFVIGLVMIILGAITFLYQGDLEGRIKIYEVRDKRTQNRRMRMMTAPPITSGEIQLNRELPVDEYHINLNELENPVYIESMGEQEKLAVERKLREGVYKGYKEFLSRTSEHTLKKMSKDEQKALAKSLRISRDAEKTYKIFHPEYETRGEAIHRLNNYKNKPRFCNKIKLGEVTYVHFTSRPVAYIIRGEGLNAEDYGEQHALAFPTREEALFWVERMKQKDASEMVGTEKVDSAVIFQTVNIPEIMSSKGKKTSIYPRVSFRANVLPESMYFFEIKNIPR